MLHGHPEEAGATRGRVAIRSSPHPPRRQPLLTASRVLPVTAAPGTSRGLLPAAAPTAGGIRVHIAALPTDGHSARDVESPTERSTGVSALPVDLSTSEEDREKIADALAQLLADSYTL